MSQAVEQAEASIDIESQVTLASFWTEFRRLGNERNFLVTTIFRYCNWVKPWQEYTSFDFRSFVANRLHSTQEASVGAIMGEGLVETFFTLLTDSGFVKLSEEDQDCIVLVFESLTKVFRIFCDWADSPTNEMISGAIYDQTFKKSFVDLNIA